MHVLIRPFLILMSLFALPVQASTVEQIFEPYGKLLQRHVTEHDLAGGGLVSSFDYRAAMTDSRSRDLIERQRQILASLESNEFDSRGTALAFWINAYNFFMIAHIVDNPEDDKPVDSVKEFGSLFNPFRVFERKRFDVAGHKHSLDGMEKGILLGEEFAERGWKDARVHFAVNCASVGCPPLRKTLYTAANIEPLLNENSRRALLTPLHLHMEGDSARLTSLFDWYASDFEQFAGSAEAFITNHLDDQRADAFEAAGQLSFIDYDWQLNSPSNIRQWLENHQ